MKKDEGIWIIPEYELYMEECYLLMTSEAKYQTFVDTVYSEEHPDSDEACEIEEEDGCIV